MAVDSNTLQAFTLKGIREDLLDVIYNISPYETPVMDRMGKVSANQTFHEWQTDTLASASSTNAFVEGSTFAADSRSATVRVGNYAQISKKSVEVSGTVLAEKLAGRKNEFTYQLALKAARELKTDMEKVIMSNQAPSAGSSSTARNLAPVTVWYATNVTMGGTSPANPTVVNGAPTTGRTDGTSTLVTLTESILATAMQGAWTSGGKPDTIICGPVNRRRISGFAGPSGTYRVNEADSHKLIATITVYESDFGPLTIVPDRFSRERDVHLMDFEYWSLAFLREFVTEDLAKTGDNERGHIVVEFTVQASNEAASALIADNSIT